MNPETDAGERLRLIRSLADSCRPDGPDLDGCIPTTKAIIAALGKVGITAIGMRLEGSLTDMPGTNAAWIAIKPERRVHYVAWLPVDRIAVDATGGQFGFQPVRLLTREEIEAQWHEVIELS